MQKRRGARNFTVKWGSARRIIYAERTFLLAFASLRRGFFAFGLSSLALILGPGISHVALAGEIRILVQSSPLAGFQYHAGETLWQEMREGDRLALVREADNPHDANAVRVEWRGQKLGYLPRAENRSVAAAMDGGEPVDARIARLRQHKNPWQRVLIEVFVVL